VRFRSPAIQIKFEEKIAVHAYKPKKRKRLIKRM
jgi:hypothetical protein